MKGYLFGLGAMIVGAGLMFVLMHGAVSADGKTERFVCSEYVMGENYAISNCETKTLDCAVTGDSLSCVKKGIFK